MSSGLTFLHQRQCPHHHIPLFHCILHTVSTAYCVYCVLHPLRTVYCVHCILWFDLFAPKTMSPPPYTTIPLHTAYCIYCILCLLCTASTAYCVHCMPYMAYIGNLFALIKCPCHPPMLLITHEIIMNQNCSFPTIPNVPSTNQKSAKKLHFFTCVANINRLSNSSSH